MAYLWAGLVVLLLMAAFGLSNREIVSVRFVGFALYQGSLGVAMIAAAAAGAFVVLLASTARQRHLGRRVNAAERRAQDLERQLAAGRGAETQIARP